MSNSQEQKKDEGQAVERGFTSALLPRRSFLQFAGVGVATTALVAVGCNNDSPDHPPLPNGVTLDFKDDFGVLNYAYALEQLEAAFYIQVASNLPTSFTAAEKAYFQDIQFHEIAHREFFKKALSTSAIGALEVDFSSINFSERASVLGAAKAFEDLGVAAYNGAGARIKTDAYLVAAGKIVSVEARHAAYIRDLISNGSFADSEVVNAQGLDMALPPNEVLAIAAKYIKTKISVINL